MGGEGWVVSWRVAFGRGATSPPRPIQEAAGSSEASDALVGTPPPLPHTPSAWRAGGARASGGLPGPGRMRRGAEPLYSPLWASKRESEPVVVLLIPL